MCGVLRVCWVCCSACVDVDVRVGVLWCVVWWGVGLCYGVLCLCSVGGWYVVVCWCWCVCVAVCVCVSGVCVVMCVCVVACACVVVCVYVCMCGLVGVCMCLDVYV